MIRISKSDFRHRAKGVWEDKAASIVSFMMRRNFFLITDWTSLTESTSYRAECNESCGNVN